MENRGGEGEGGEGEVGRYYEHFNVKVFDGCLICSFLIYTFQMKGGSRT